MYQYLIKIGLKNYLNDYFFNKKWIPEQYLKNLNDFISHRSNEQIRILQNKFLRTTDHLSLNDHFHEIMIAYVFHPNGLFLDDNVAGGSPDIIDNGINVEVKTINASPEEIERIKVLVPNSSRCSLPEDLGYESRFKKKFQQRVDKAKIQVKNSGIIYLVWDSTFVKEWDKRKFTIENLLSDFIQEKKSELPEIIIRTVFCGDLIDLITKSQIKD